MKLEPGIYRATVRGVPDQTVMLTDSNSTSDSWVSMLAINVGNTSWRTYEDWQVIDARPLVVLDLEDPIALANLLRICAEGGDTRGGLLRTVFTDAARQIEAQIKPPGIPEPGLWGVVEARTFHTSIRRWVHHEEGQWITEYPTSFVEWADLLDPTLIRPGIGDES